MIRVAGTRIDVETKTLTAAFEAGVLVSLVRRSDGREFVERAAAVAATPLAMVYPNAGPVALTGTPGEAVVARAIGDCSAEVRFESWDGDGLLEIAEDPLTGDVVVEPSACTSRPGLQAVRWTIAGIAPGLELVAPFFQGVKLPLDDPLIAHARWHWPHLWEAGFAVLQDAVGRGGFWVHCRDERFRFKALQVGPPDRANATERSLGFDAETAGPIDRNLASGGLAWRLNVFDGDWREPAAQYRDWFAATFAPRSIARPAWLSGLRLAVSWCPCEPAILDALAARLDPKTVLLHVPNWRTDPYDECYPTYVASPAGRAFVEKARTTGFRVMPHMNSVDMDPTHPVYATIRDFQYRDLVSKRVQGWVWSKGVIRTVPESNAARLRHRDMKTMVKVHPGLAQWRSILAENVDGAVRDLGLDAVFLDVTLCAWNTDNGLVQEQTTAEGMARLVERVARLGAGLAVGGEGRNETTAIGQAFAQVHLFRSHQTSCEGLVRAGGTALGEFLFGGWCRSFGYSNLSGATADSAMRMDVHVSLDAIPTVTVRSAAEIERPNDAVSKMLALARA